MSTTHRKLAIILALVALCASASFARTARAADLVRLSGGISNQWSWTGSLDALQDTNRLLVGDIRLGVGVWDGLSIEAGYRRMVGDGDVLSGWSTATSLHVADLGARYDYFLLSWLSTYARAGASFAHCELELENGSLKTTPDAMTGGLYGALGVSARFPRSWFGGVDDAKGGRGFTVGVQFDIGYGWFADMGMKARPQLDGAVAEMKQSSVDLGTLSLHGLIYTFAVALHL